jgi:hypothetical protein
MECEITMKWFRMYNDILDDHKIAKMSPKTFKLFSFLLAFSSECESNGIIIEDITDLSWRFRVPPKTIKTAIKELIELDIISVLNEEITILNWNKRQFSSDDVAERVKRHRQKKGMLQETLVETPPEQKQIQKQIQKQKRTNSYAVEREIFEVARKCYKGTKRGLEVEFDNFIKKHKDWKSVLPELLPAIENRIEASDNHKSTGAFFPEWANFSTWINQRKWEEEYPTIKTGGPF